MDQEVLLYAGLMVEIGGDQIRAEERERCAKLAEQDGRYRLAQKIRRLPV